ncbi:MAG: hydantoinase B/oxoprolinase family protein, partial [Candidatus Wallbacteria bacterium]|nr:hydantoinase B/oxoprolinase family protein [Candidatus Wallbacteria bacterium]
APYGLQGGADGQPGQDSLWSDGRWTVLPGKTSRPWKKGERLRIETPGGGGFGTKRGP